MQLIDKQGKPIVELNRKRGVYYVSNIKGDHAYMAAIHTPPYGGESNFVSNSTFFHEAEITDNAPVFLSPRDDNHMLWHRRVCHMGHAKLAGILKVADCESRVQQSSNTICEVYKLTKARKQTSRVLAEHKPKILDLISVDIAGPFPESIQGNKYFIEIVDNHTRRL